MFVIKQEAEGEGIGLPQRLESREAKGRIMRPFVALGGRRGRGWGGGARIKGQQRNTFYEELNLRSSLPRSPGFNLLSPVPLGRDQSIFIITPTLFFRFPSDAKIQVDDDFTAKEEEENNPGKESFYPKGSVG